MAELLARRYPRPRPLSRAETATELTRACYLARAIAARASYLGASGTGASSSPAIVRRVAWGLERDSETLIAMLGRLLGTTGPTERGAA